MPEYITNEKFYGICTEIEDQDIADAYFRFMALVFIKANPKWDRSDSVHHLWVNLCYFAGYFDDVTFERTQRLFTVSKERYLSLTNGTEPRLPEQKTQLGRKAPTTTNGG